LDASEEAAEDGQFKGVKEEGQGGLGGEGVAQGVGVVESDGCELGGVGAMLPDSGVGEGGLGKIAVKFNAFNAKKWEAGGKQGGATFAGADVEEDGLFDGCGEVEALQPEIEQGLKNAGSDAVIGSEFHGFDGGAAGDSGGRDEAGGVRAVDLVEGVDDGLVFFAGH